MSEREPSRAPPQNGGGSGHIGRCERQAEGWGRLVLQGADIMGGGRQGRPAAPGGDIRQGVPHEGHIPGSTAAEAVEPHALTASPSLQAGVPGPQCGSGEEGVVGGSTQPGCARQRAQLAKKVVSGLVAVGGAPGRCLTGRKTT